MKLCENLTGMLEDQSVEFDVGDGKKERGTTGG